MATSSTMSTLLLLIFLCFPFVLLELPFSLATGSTAPKPRDQPTCDFAVYPYWSRWTSPAVYYYNGGRYKLAQASETTLQLSPEWDESNSTYYVRLSDSGATYVFAHLTLEIRPFVSLSHADIIIYNVDTGRYLSWRDEDGERFLIETEGLSFFQFSVDEGVSLACPRILGACCVGYNILSAGSDYGLGPYVEDGATYFKLQSAADGLFPFVLIDASASSSSSDSHTHPLMMPTDS